MRVAIVHDWLVIDAGAEKVLSALLELYPEADVFSLVDYLNEEERESVLHGKNAYTTFIQNLPFSKKHFRNYFFLFPLAIERMKLTEYDLLISSSWAVAKGIPRKKPQQLHISYCYTPVRYAWDLYDEYTKSLPLLKKMFVQSVLAYIRKWDIKTVERVDYFIADSCFVAERIKRIYKRDSEVIYPPVNVEYYSLHEAKEDFYLTASRLVSYKKTLLIVKAFNEMPQKKLVVIGRGEDLQKIRAIAKSNITVMGYQKTEILKNYMQRAKAFVYAAVEDFGIVPVEAMACGTPVIALGKGGTAETVEDGFSGVHFHKQTKEAIIDAVNVFESKQFDAKAISHAAQKFSKQRFCKQIKEFIDEKVI